MKTVIGLYTLFVVLGAFTFGAPALAAEGPRQRVVDYSDLNLASARGVETLYRRIASAARVVCEPSINLGYHQKAEARICATKAVLDAVRDVNDAGLTAYHLERTGQGASEKENLASRK